jgi:hypothetical protein
VALYDREQNRIIIMPYYWDMPEDKKVRTITHELIHSLIASGDKAKEGNIEEGLVDYLTQKVMQNLGINVDPTYFIEVLAVNWFNEMFGEQNLINSIRSGAIGEDFNALLKPGTWEKCNYALCEMRLTEESRKNKPNVIYDILAHAAVETGKQREALRLLEQDYIVLQRYGINIDCEYFCKLLS